MGISSVNEYGDLMGMNSQLRMITGICLKMLKCWIWPLIHIDPTSHSRISAYSDRLGLPPNPRKRCWKTREKSRTRWKKVNSPSEFCWVLHPGSSSKWFSIFGDFMPFFCCKLLSKSHANSHWWKIAQVVPTMFLNLSYPNVSLLSG